MPASEQINAARSEADRLREENETLKARLAEMENSAGKEADDADNKENASEADNENPEQNETGTDSSEKDWSAMEYKELQEAAKAKGINPAQKKAALIEELEKAE